MNKATGKYTCHSGKHTCHGYKGSNVKNQGPTAKQHAIEVLEYTHTSHHMINTEIAYVVALNKRILTLQKQQESVGIALSY